MRLTSAGNFGIGTTTPAQRLSVNGSIQAIDFTTSGGQNIIIGDDAFMADMDLPNRTAIIGLQNNTIGELQLGNSATNPTLSGNPGFLFLNQELRIQNNVNVFRRANRPVIFSDNFTTFGFGAGVHLANAESEEGGFYADGNYAMVYSPGDNDLVKFVDEDGWDNAGNAYDGGSLRARIDNGGTFFTISDINQKEDIKNLTGSLMKVMAISGYTYNFKLLPGEVKKNSPKTKGIGVLAQEVERVFPEAVSNIDGHYMVNYSAFAPLLIEAVKEQQSQIETLKQENQKMRAELDELKYLHQELENIKKLLNNKK